MQNTHKDNLQAFYALSFIFIFSQRFVSAQPSALTVSTPVVMHMVKHGNIQVCYHTGSIIGQGLRPHNIIIPLFNSFVRSVINILNKFTK